MNTMVAPWLPNLPRRTAGRFFLLPFFLSMALCSHLLAQSADRSKNLKDLHAVDDEYFRRYTALKSQEPAKEYFDSRTLPRYKEMQEKVNSLVSSSRLTILRQPVSVVQRVSPNLVLTGDVYGPAGAFTNCYDFCQYMGK